MTCQHRKMVMGGTNENSLYCVECKMTYSGQDIVSLEAENTRLASEEQRMKFMLGALLWSGDLDSKTVSQVRGMADDFRSELEKERDTLQAKLDVAEKESHERELTILGNGHVLKHKQGIIDDLLKERKEQRTRAEAAEKERDAARESRKRVVRLVRKFNDAAMTELLDKLEAAEEDVLEAQYYSDQSKRRLEAAAQRVEQLAKENAELRERVKTLKDAADKVFVAVRNYSKNSSFHYFNVMFDAMKEYDANAPVSENGEVKHEAL